MLVGYMRVSKADGSQTTDPQRDALVEAGVDDERLYEDKTSGRLDDRPGLAECLDAELNKDLSHPVRASVAEESTSPGTAVVPDLLAGLRWTSGAAQSRKEIGDHCGPG